MILEICCGDIEAVKAAAAGGARRIELCSGLTEGGLTPSIALIRGAAELIPEVNVLVRPRPGDFIYSEAEKKMIAEDIRAAVNAGVTGVVIGALTPTGDIDTEACSTFIRTAKTSAQRMGANCPNITFHRAFDVCRNPESAIEEVIGLGCDCLLTSGLQPSADSGIPMLKKLVKLAGKRIAIVAAAGVNPGNARRIVEETGVDGVHSTARKSLISAMKFRNPPIGFAEDRLATSDEIVRLLRQEVCMSPSIYNITDSLTL